MQMGRTLAEATTPADATFSETSIKGGVGEALYGTIGLLSRLFISPPE